MINSVKINGINYANAQKQSVSGPDSSRISEKNTLQKNPQNNPTFGYYREENEGAFSKLKHGIISITSGIVGLVGFNAALWWLQNFVNGKILVGKINKHFTKDITDNNKLANLAFEMKDSKENKGLNNLQIFEGTPGEAYYSHVADKGLPANRVVVGKDSYSSLFHEIGHAKVENKSFLMKNLQRFRGHYTPLSLALYALLSGNKDKKSPDWVIPLLAFSPELLTEGMASHHGLKFLKEKVKEGKLEKSVFSKIKKSYITCFGTYLFVPVSIILLDAIRNSAHKHKQERRIAKQQARFEY